MWILQRWRWPYHKIVMTSNYFHRHVHPPTTISKMKRISQLPRLTSSKTLSSFPARLPAQRCLHTSPTNPATVAPITASGPPPKVPVPSAEHVDSRVARRRKQSELLKRGQDLRAVAGGSGGGTAKQKRFWKNVRVQEVDGMPMDLYLRLKAFLVSILILRLCNRNFTSPSR